MHSNLSRWLQLTVYLRVHRWTDWAVLATALLGYGIITRLLTTPVVLDKWANAWHQTWWVVVLGLWLGAMEDVCVYAIMLAVLWTFDYLTLKSRGKRLQLARFQKKIQEATDMEQGMKNLAKEEPKTSVWMEAVELSGQFGRLVVYTLVFLGAISGLYLDSIFLRARKIRFSSDFVLMFFRERDAAGELQMDAKESWMLFWTTLYTLLLAIFVGLLGACWINLVEWNILQFVDRCPVYQWGIALGVASGNVVPSNDHVESDEESNDSKATAKEKNADGLYATNVSFRFTPPYFLAFFLVLFFIMTLALAKVLPTVVGLIALNPVLNEPVKFSTGVQFLRACTVLSSKSMSEFIERETEKCQLFNPNSLYRRTVDFDGPLAFDIKIGREERPNVLLLVIESFRMQDSQFLLNATSRREIEAATASLLPPNVTLTPHFDKWASRGVALGNFWSTWRTSRSLETLLFGQMPYDSVTETGTTFGRLTTNLSGLPQLFKAKGYDTIFTTGSRTDYDYWDTFLPSHGFDTVFDYWDLVDIVENELERDDWTQGNHILTYWGIHDDLSYTALSHLLRTRQFAQNDAKKRSKMRDEIAPDSNTTADFTVSSSNPWFATHYTISSHVPFQERPDWFFHYVTEHGAEMEALFAPLYKDHEHEQLIRDYVHMRFFSDMVFGRFMEQLKKDTVLNNTIVVIVGDHGQAPERGSATPEQNQIATSRIAGAIIAEGRIQTPVVLEDAASQSDILNTLADIVGLPPNGLLQTSIGRSLKRKPPKGIGKRVVFSNNPATNLAAVIGNTRLHFFADESDAVRAYHTLHDPLQAHDVMGDLSKDRVADLLQICNDGRALNAYFKHRWDQKCLVQPTCDT